jgi:hypothetical protein
MTWRGLYSPGSKQRQLSGSCQHRNRHSGSIKWREIFKSSSTTISFSRRALLRGVKKLIRIQIWWRISCDLSGAEREQSYKFAILRDLLFEITVPKIDIVYSVAHHCISKYSTQYHTSPQLWKKICNFYVECFVSDYPFKKELNAANNKYA